MKDLRDSEDLTIPDGVLVGKGLALLPRVCGEMCSGSETGSYLRLIDPRTLNESEEEEEEEEET